MSVSPKTNGWEWQKQSLCGVLLVAFGLRRNCCLLEMIDYTGLPTNNVPPYAAKGSLAGDS